MTVRRLAKENPTDETAYLTKVRQALDELGSPDSGADISASGDYWKHCRHLNIDPKVCAATIYTGERHRHEVARTVIKENTAAAAEAPVREEWEVVVKRAGADADSITSSAGRRPDEVTAGNAVFAGFKDDEKAASFAKKMTKAGYISSFGPRRDYTLHEEAREQREVSKRQALGALMLNWHTSQGDPLYAVGSYYIGDMKYPRQEMVESAKNKASALANRLSNSPEKRELRKIVRGLDHFALVDYPYGPQASAEEDREWSKVTLNSEADATALWRQLKTRYTVDRMGKNIWTTASYDVVLKALDKAGVKGHIHREVEEAAEVAAETPEADELFRKKRISGMFYIGYIDRGARAWFDHPFSLGEAKNELRRWKRRGYTAWVEDDNRKFVPVPGTLTQPFDDYGQEAPVAEAPAAAPADAAECASCIPWQKVSRDANVAAANSELAKKYGAIKNAQDVYRVVGDALNKETQEVFLVIPLDLRGELKAPPYEVARGQYSRVAVGVENVMAAVYHANCEAFVCAHQHPSGKATPSGADRHLTEEIRKAVAPLGKGITFVDHVVIGQKCAYSITQRKMYKCS